MDRSELLPCPFCGGKPEWGHHDFSGGEHHRCADCGVEVSGGPENWNRRAAPPPPAEQASGESVAVLREMRDTGDVSDWRAWDAALDAAIAALSQRPEEAA